MTAPSPADTDAPAAAVAAPTARARRRRLAWLILPPVAALVLGIVIWQLIIVIWSVPGYLMPSPLTLVHTIRDQMSTMWTPTWVTMRES
jgi:NitT/TauT family transport system permease protein